MIAQSRSKNLRDSLVMFKLPTREEDDCTYVDLVRKEEDPPSSPALQTQQDGSWLTHLVRYIQTAQVYSVTARGLVQDPSRCPANTSGSGTWEQRFHHVHRFWGNRGRPNKHGPTPTNRRQDHKDHSSNPSQADTHGKNISDKYRR